MRRQQSSRYHEAFRKSVFKWMSTMSVLAFLIITIIQLPSSIYITAQMLTGTNRSSHNDIISTRGHFDHITTGELVPEHNTTDYLFYNDDNNTALSKIQNGIICPPQKEIIIYIHGVWTDETSAKEQFNRTDMSLAINYYTVPLIGFSWDSNTPLNKAGWEIAKQIAENNGPKLAQFILDFKNKCKDTDIRLIAHSLGAAVVNSTLVSLSNNQALDNNNGFNITSVHLLGAAMDRSATASNTTFGKAIEKVVDKFYNLRNSEDNMLEYVYGYVENNDALGLLGIQHSVPLPRDYIEREVDSEITPIPDADGNNKLDCFDFFIFLPGDNHCGYIGSRDISPFNNTLRDDGSMDVVVQDWLSD